MLAVPSELACFLFFQSFVSRSFSYVMRVGARVFYLTDGDLILFIRFKEHDLYGLSLVDIDLYGL